METILIQILRRLTQPQVWRILSFSSSIVGLLCYALSSSFNHLFGKWRLLKIFLYSLFSFIICFSILFAKAWQRSTSLQLKIHLTFLVFTITTVYSFFFDKVNKKPDGYNLVSCAVFAIMSLSLSRQTYCGFELDLLNFFSAYLILQLMKIKLWLVIVGAGFSYSLVLIRSSLEVPAEIGHFGLQVQDQVVIEVHSHSQEPSGDSDSDNVIQVDSSLVTGNYNAHLLMPREANTANAAIISFNSPPENGDQHAVLESRDNLPITSKEEDEDARNGRKEKRHSAVALLVNHDDIMVDTLSSGTINDLHEIAKCLIGGGFEKEWPHVYCSFRKESLEENLSGLGLKKHSIEDVQNMPWDDLEDEIVKWIKASNAAFKILFPRERQLCDRIFYGFSSIANLSFVEVCRDSTVQLLKFADALAIGSGSPERLFRILDVFETLRELIPELESLLSDQYSVWLRNEAITIWKRLGKASRGIFIQLENLICRDPAKKAVPSGGLHPITRYVMNYLRAACRSRQTLEQVFEGYGHPLKEYPA